MGTFFFVFIDSFLNRKTIVTITLYKQNLWDITIKQCYIYHRPLKLFCGGSLMSLNFYLSKPMTLVIFKL